jgi:hypothetical protein
MAQRRSILSSCGRARRQMWRPHASAPSCQPAHPSARSWQLWPASCARPAAHSRRPPLCPPIQLRATSARRAATRQRVAAHTDSPSQGVPCLLPQSPACTTGEAKPSSKRGQAEPCCRAAACWPAGLPPPPPQQQQQQHPWARHSWLACSPLCPGASGSARGRPRSPHYATAAALSCSRPWSDRRLPLAPQPQPAAAAAAEPAAPGGCAPTSTPTCCSRQPLMSGQLCSSPSGGAEHAQKGTRCQVGESRLLVGNRSRSKTHLGEGLARGWPAGWAALHKQALAWYALSSSESAD